MTKADKKWLACAIDTDGCISVQLGKYSITPRVSFVVTDRPLADEFVRLVSKFGRTPPAREYARQAGRPVFSVRVSRRTVLVPLLRAVRPYLVAKGAQAAHALALFELMPGRGRLPGGSYVRTIDLPGVREAVDKLRRANRRLTPSEAPQGEPRETTIGGPARPGKE